MASAVFFGHPPLEVFAQGLTRFKPKENRAIALSRLEFEIVFRFGRDDKGFNIFGLVRLSRT